MKIDVDIKNKTVHFEREPMAAERFELLCWTIASCAVCAFCGFVVASLGVAGLLLLIAAAVIIGFGFLIHSV